MAIQQPASDDWADTKRYWWLLGALTITLPLLAALLALSTGWHIFWWFGPLFAFGVIPVLDLLIGVDSENPPESIVPRLESDRYYRYVVYLATFVVYVAFAGAIWIVGTKPLVWYDYLGFALSLGAATGISINTAHELGHKTSRLERWLAKITLAPVAYGHFFVEHNRGHHVRVATPNDPASARYGESFWAFLPRTVTGSVASAWRLERERLARSGRSVWSWRNEVLQAWAMTVALWSAAIAFGGAKVVPFLLIQAAYGASLLEVVNYVEHYGLGRRQLPTGRYERCTPQHSWNSNHVVTNLFLYQLQRHADHHANPTRSYQALRHFDDSPQLPAGYAAMILLAYVPPLWFRVMNPRVVAHYGADMAQSNIKPSIRQKVLADLAIANAS
ncbi:alkane 1-monooxygenase [Burkholderia thailandensis]|uniref:Alkane-1 monooxygenase n=1 Tax=Burkholderia thailandensis (strain ATCC 700388 / DSM 13276 / CCUG 48851 / CIP 106301 / E264) TaxID=271848 RepID=Q2SXK3_BURTA|nr:alkane 1-monooxygenase [Burkholderia thailandensis]ABC39350.1 alkane-1 monooxygenase [Burkholderia thailandensis E264]AHI74752.1 fatty acid desaturase family protein [Burkholderia thailandensis 2002721723]AHI77599.1 fatty acid desaturase family protein [Burkholderia thailandensis E444]AIC87924.1 fatty acid desaturase family protein [Burkholderia thailandensis USAMRU Malaysia \